MLTLFRDIQPDNALSVSRGQLWLVLAFPLFTLLSLSIDSIIVPVPYFDDRQIVNVLAIVYFIAMLMVSPIRLRRLMLAMVPLSYIGELIFCKLLGMYAYRGEVIPLYVPFGHAIVYASGYIFAHTRLARSRSREFRRFFALGFFVLFLFAGLFLNDLLTVFSGVLFFILLRRKRWHNMYFFIALCVIFIELGGTYFKCWTWEPEAFGMLPTANPPMGAVFFYAGGDVLLAKIVDLWEKKLRTTT
jgi:hypothetical protein